ncbi:MAG: hypothetical protein K9K37_11665 [Desulfocapsa sp.]|nr:hypothetical protein [Desulfocapsa sp.]
MESSKVPQDNISTYADNKKAFYATDGDGNYTLVPSSGWEVEEAVTIQALLELERLTRRAHKEVIAGKSSPLYFHMYACRMDLQVLAETTGIFKWRIRRHFKPAVFNNLSKAVLERYSNALGISIKDLCSLPDLSENDT